MLSFDLNDPNWEEKWEEEMSKLLPKELDEKAPEYNRGITTRDLDALSDYPIGLEECDFN